MATSGLGYRLSATTGLHRGDRAYQQDQVQVLPHARVPGCLMGVLADGMGGKSGGARPPTRCSSPAQQLFERYSPSRDDPTEALKQLVLEAHLMIKLTAITSEEEPHSTIAAFLISPTRECDFVHAGDSRIYHFRAAEMVSRSIDHSYVQRLVDERQISEEEANNHPQSNLLTGCLGTFQDPPLSQKHIDRLEIGDSVLSCSDGLWHYFTPRELGRSSTRCRRARPPRCWSARPASAPAARATTCRSPGAGRAARLTVPRLGLRRRCGARRRQRRRRIHLRHRRIDCVAASSRRSAARCCPGL
jgi:serine/threonine protein phosphatase PrpC